MPKFKLDLFESDNFLKNYIGLKKEGNIVKLHKRCAMVLGLPFVSPMPRGIKVKGTQLFIFV